jgi:hypothetical protein
MLLRFIRVLSANRVALIILVVVFADLLSMGRSWLEWRGEDDWLTPYVPLAQTLIEDKAARVYSPSYSLPQQVAEAYDLRLFGGVDPYQIEGVVEAVAQAGGIERTGYSVVVPPLNEIVGDDPSTANRRAVPNTALLAEWNVSHVVASYPIEHPRLELADEIAGTYVYRNMDYTGGNSAVTLPNWRVDWAGLPDGATIRNLNQLTLVTALVGGLSLLVCVFVVMLPKR